MQNKQVFVQDWGLIDYQEAWTRQETLFQEIIKIKTEQKTIVAGSKENIHPSTINYLIFCEHFHVYTLGRSGKPAHLLLGTKELQAKKVAYYPVNRGGDITYHGPGQIVVYPILDLANFFMDIALYLRTLEEAVILTLADYQLTGERYTSYTGVWLDVAAPKKVRKLCAIGIRCSRWVTMHGLALNVNTDLNYFNHIIPCGINNKPVTSLQAELGSIINIEEVKQRLCHHLGTLFNMRLQP